MYDHPATRDKHMRKIPKRVDEWSKTLFEHAGYIYYERKGKKVKCFCGACGASYEGKTYTDEDYEFVRPKDYIEKPVHNMDTTCPCCGLKTQYKARGMCRYEYAHHATYCIGQDMKDAFVFRIFTITQTMRLDTKVEYHPHEYLRIWLQKGKKKVKDALVHSWYSGKTEWLESYPVSIPAFKYYPGTLGEIEKSDLLKYSLKFGEFKSIEWYSAFARYPEMEFMLSFGAKEVVNCMVWQQPFGYNPRGKMQWDRLRISKPRFKDWIKQKGDFESLRIYQLEKRVGKQWNNDNLEAAKKIIRRSYRTSREKKTIQELFTYTEPVKIANYIQKYADKQKKNEFSAGDYRFELAERKYIDYINMRVAAGYDLNNDIILFPKDLDRRHDEMVLQMNQVKISKRCEEVNEKYQNIKKNYKKLFDIYGASAAGYIIRPAKEASEIVMEGQLLHHCVGGDWYLEKHNKGDSYILFLRDIKEQDVPLITIEIDGKDDHIRQWYGAYDKKPNEAFFNGWLKKYLKELKKYKEKQKKDKNSKNKAKKTNNQKKLKATA